MGWFIALVLVLRVEERHYSDAERRLAAWQPSEESSDRFRSLDPRAAGRHVAIAHRMWCVCVCVLRFENYTSN